MATQLHQILALEKGTKPRVYKDVTEIHRQLTAGNARLSGITRSYKPKDEDGDRLPSEQTLLQYRAKDGLKAIQNKMTELFDLTFVKDSANRFASASIVVDGQVLAADVPVTYLLFLEKQLLDLATVISKLPVLDASERWEYDPAVDAYTTSSETTRTKKVPRNHVKAAPTDKHPAQVEVFFEDVIVGYWTTTKLSGALPQAEVDRMKARVVKLANAVKVAREEANSTDVVSRAIGDTIFDYLFED